MSAAKVLKYGMGLRNPETLEAVGFGAGTKKSDLPDWAKKLVHDDDFGSADETDGGSEDSGSGSSEGSGPDYAGMKPEDLQAMADERKLEVTGTGANGNVKKGDLVAALTADDEAKAAQS